jgi:hypothetical protein
MVKASRFMIVLRQEQRIHAVPVMCLVGDGVEEIPDSFQRFKIYGSILRLPVEKQGE